VKATRPRREWVNKNKGFSDPCFYFFERIATDMYNKKLKEYKGRTFDVLCTIIA